MCTAATYDIANDAVRTLSMPTYFLSTGKCMCAEMVHPARSPRGRPAKWLNGKSVTAGGL